MPRCVVNGQQVLYATYSRVARNGAVQLCHMPIHQLHGLLITRQVSSVELTQNCLSQIDQLNGQVNAFVQITRDQALADAQAADIRLARRENITPLTGIPVALKDNIFTRGVLTRCASQLFASNRPKYDAAVVERLLAAGAVRLGKTNMDEFAMGSWAMTSMHGPALNPWDLERLPGGSSGGSAAAVAARMAIASLGTDTGGSVRQPAALCGLVGLRPTHGIISAYGLVHSVASLDTIGPLCRDVMDCALLFNVLVGEDSRDVYSTPARQIDTLFTEEGLDGLRVGVVQELVMGTLDRDTNSALALALSALSGLGAHVEGISIPAINDSLETYAIIAAAGAAVSFKDVGLDGLDIGNEVIQRILTGARYLGGDQQDKLQSAQRAQQVIRRSFNEVFERGFDILLAPTSPMVAIRRDEYDAGYDPERLRQSDRMVIPAALAGLPALSVPAGYSSNGMPIGMQFIGRALSEQLLLQAAYAYEQNTDWHKRRPSLLGAD